MTLNDAILQATGGPTVNQGLANWFGKSPNETLQDAERRWLITETGSADGTNEDLWMLFLVGYSGTINDRKLAYWLNPDVDPPIFDGVIPNLDGENNEVMAPYDASVHFTTGGKDSGSSGIPVGTENVYDVAAGDFVNAAGGDFHLSETSVLRGAGEGGVDIGAFQYES